MPPRIASRRARRAWASHAFRAPEAKPLLRATDNGAAVRVNPLLFAPAQRDRGWGAFVEGFIRANEPALARLDCLVDVAGGPDGAVVRIKPGGHTGAVPLRSAQTQAVVGGFVVVPRFEWAGVGRVLQETGWAAGPEFLDLPLVPGSGREIPPWVLAGPVIGRLAELLRTAKRSYRDKVEDLKRPRGRILWAEYTSEKMSAGKWDTLPCRYSDLAADPKLRRWIRWGLERVRTDLVSAGGHERLAMLLAHEATRLLQSIAESPLFPARRELESAVGRRDVLLSAAVGRGLQALGWLVDERGLGGGRELDGLAWTLPLDRLWELYVASYVAGVAQISGGQLFVGHKGQTVFPLQWSDPSLRSLGHLTPDLVLRRHDELNVFDAKYKAHFAELDQAGWLRMADDLRDSHRADMHQALAYAALFDAPKITTTLVYPLRASTFEALHARGRDIARAQLFHGGRQLTLELQGLPFGSSVTRATGGGRPYAH
jgi:hypothetical protein